MSYVIQRVSRGPRAVAAYDDARGRSGLGLVVGGAPLPTKTGLVSTLKPTTTLATTSQTLSTAPALVLQPVTTQITAQISDKFAPPPVVIQKTDPTKTCDAGYFYSAKKAACTPNCGAGYFLDANDDCKPIAPTATTTQAPTTQTGAEAQKCAAGFYLDSAGKCMPIQDASAPAVPAPKPASGGGGGATWQARPAARSTDASLSPDLEMPIVAASAPPKSGLSVTHLLVIGGIGLGALYLLTRNRKAAP